MKSKTERSDSPSFPLTPSLVYVKKQGLKVTRKQRVESALNHLKGSSDVRAFSRPELTFVRLGGWDCIKLHFIKKILRNY